MNHTLRIAHSHNGIFLESDRGRVAEMLAGYQQTREQDARDIVRAVNSHESLVNALKIARATIERLTVSHNGFASTHGTICTINAALAQATTED